MAHWRADGSNGRLSRGCAETPGGSGRLRRDGLRQCLGLVQAPMRRRCFRSTLPPGGGSAVFWPSSGSSTVSVWIET
jgi:hypothetical protein